MLEGGLNPAQCSVQGNTHPHTHTHTHTHTELRETASWQGANYGQEDCAENGREKVCVKEGEGRVEEGRCGEGKVGTEAPLKVGFTFTGRIGATFPPFLT